MQKAIVGGIVGFMIVATIGVSVKAYQKPFEFAGAAVLAAIGGCVFAFVPGQES